MADNASCLQSLKLGDAPLAAAMGNARLKDVRHDLADTVCSRVAGKRFDPLVIPRSVTSRVADAPLPLGIFQVAFPWVEQWNCSQYSYDTRENQRRRGGGSVRRHCQFGLMGVFAV